MGEGREVAAVHLVGGDAQAFGHHAPLEVGREQPVVATQQEPRRHIGPRVEGPRRRERRAGLGPQVGGRLGDDVGWDVVEEHGDLVERLRRQAESGHRRGVGDVLPGVRPPVTT
jgi:hypothetical protein